MSFFCFFASVLLCNGETTFDYDMTHMLTQKGGYTINGLGDGSVGKLAGGVRKSFLNGLTRCGGHDDCNEGSYCLKTPRGDKVCIDPKLQDNGAGKVGKWCRQDNQCPDSGSGVGFCLEQGGAIGMCMTVDMSDMTTGFCFKKYTNFCKRDDSVCIAKRVETGDDASTLGICMKVRESWPGLCQPEAPSSSFNDVDLPTCQQKCEEDYWVNNGFLPSELSGCSGYAYHPEARKCHLFGGALSVWTDTKRFTKYTCYRLKECPGYSAIMHGGSISGGETSNVKGFRNIDQNSRGSIVYFTQEDGFLKMVEYSGGSYVKQSYFAKGAISWPEDPSSIKQIWNVNHVVDNQNTEGTYLIRNSRCEWPESSLLSSASRNSLSSANRVNKALKKALEALLD